MTNGGQSDAVSFTGKGTKSKDPLPVPAIICDAGKLAPIAMLQQLGRHRIPIVAIADDRNAIGLASRYISKKIIAPVPSHHPDYIGFLVDSVPRGVLFYSNDANAENIARHREELVRAGFSLLISDIGVLESVAQKERLYETSLHCGVKVPKSVAVSAANLADSAADVGYPCILKSTNLAGGVYEMVPDAHSLEPAFHRMYEIIHSSIWKHRNAGLMLQKWVSQKNVSLWNFNACVKNGEIVSFSMGRRLRTDIRRDGSIGSLLLYGETAYDESVFQANKRLLQQLKFDGIMESEWSLDSTHPEELYLYDFNPRPSGNIRWTLKSGVDMAHHYYRLSLGMPVSNVQPMASGIKYFKVICRDNDFLTSLDNPHFSWVDKLRVLGQDFAALLNAETHAVEIVDVRDLGPTLRAARDLLTVFGQKLLGGFRKLMRFLGFRPQQVAQT
jgi:predicted ATP-grasp superfamily ATP-dependent carboligase